MDIQFTKENIKFNVRTSCIIKDKKHENIILNILRAVTDHEAYLLPGGRTELLENTEQAVAREIKEELGIDLEYKLISIEENIAESINFHMLEFVFYSEVDDFSKIKSIDDGWDQFKIIPIKEIDNVDIRPKTINNLIKQEEYLTISHHINYDWYQKND